MSNKLKLLDKINDAFIIVAEQDKNKEYSRYLKSINREIIKNIDNLDSAKIKSIVMAQRFNIKDTVLLFAILNAITLIVNNKRLTAKEKKSLAPVIAILGIYSLAQPKALATRLMRINSGRGLNENEKKVRKLLKKYYKDNEKAIARSIKQANNDLVRQNRKYANNVTKRIRKDINKMLGKNKSIKTIERTISEKYQVKTSTVQRNLDTELHAQVETVKLEMSKEAGFTHKTWKTQDDSKVRKTNWHNQVANKRIPIDSDFRASGLKASRPGDPRLPPGERIRCRCYLIYD